MKTVTIVKTEFSKTEATSVRRFVRALRTSNWRKNIGLLCVMLAAAGASPAQDQQASAGKLKFRVLADINTPPYGDNGALVQGTDGNLYGTTLFGGTMGAGTVYKMTPAGAVTTIYNFCSLSNCADGGYPSFGPLASGTDGNLYGVTGSGGVSGNGTIFNITPTGMLTTIYNVGSADGSSSYGVVLGPDGNFYGTMLFGGAFNNGTVFEVTPQGTFTTLYSFCSQANCADGGSPFAVPVFGADGNLYGLTTSGGANGLGTVYRLSRGGTLTTLHSFDGTDGDFGVDAMIQTPDGNFYGLTENGGTGGGAGGVFFRITPSGAYTVLYNFCSLANCADGNLPTPLVYANDGNFYGAALGGGNSTAPECNSNYIFGGCGTIFKITPEGALTTLHVFNGLTDGDIEQTLTQATNGIFYGADSGGGTYNDGVIYALSVGLGPFVATVPTSGKVGETIQILGYDLSGTTSVRFNGTLASFMVESGTLIKATVPAGATSGLVTVASPSGTLSSNARFQIRP